MNDPLKETLIRVSAVSSLLIEEWRKNGFQNRTLAVLLDCLEQAVIDHEAEIKNRSGQSLKTSSPSIVRH